LAAPPLRKFIQPVKIAPNYKGPVVYVKDASVNTFVVSQLMSDKTHYNFIGEIEAEYKALREKQTKKVNLLSLDEAKNGNQTYFKFKTRHL